MPSEPRDNPADAATHRGGESAESAGSESTQDVTVPLAGSATPPQKLGRPELEIGNYRLLQKVGEGGMGEVWEAQQEQPVRRRVALKLVKWGMDTADFLVRFESERQALALMDHPCIARVFDGGATPSGRPYFVMEFVRGIPINRYCDENRLSTRKRLELFVQVCRGVQHAHQKGIIHRDLKPSNILVAVHDNEPVAKIIDFGVAKATGQRLIEQTIFTELGQWVGTPEYMSPEQAGVSSLDVDTRSDVYSLGVILYELLVGRRPLDSHKLREGGFAGLQQRIRDSDPARPSTRVSSLGPDSEAVAKNRGTDPRSLVRRLKGDLDWITLKALEKDRTRRYDTPSAMALDIERHLNDVPVEARPPSTSYRLTKFVRRHRVGVAFGTALVLTWIAFSVVMLLQARRIARERDRANEEAETARQVSVFLEDLFEVSDPSEARGSTVTAREILDRGAERVSEELADEPLVQARLMRTIGSVYRNLGLLDEADPVLRSALRVSEEAGASEVERARSLYHLARLESERGANDAARERAKAALGLFESTLGPDHPETADGLSVLAAVALGKGEYEEATELYQRTLQIRELAFGRDHEKVGESLDGLGTVHARQGHPAEAEKLFRRALAIHEATLPADDPRLANALSSLGSVLGELGRDAEAQPLLERALAIFEKVLGENHREVAICLANLAAVHGRQGRLDRAEELLLRSAAIDAAIYGPDHSQTAESYKNLGVVNLMQDELGEAESYLLRALAIDERELGPEHISVIFGHNMLGSLALRRGNLAGAEEHYRQALAAAEAGIGGEHPEAATALQGLAAVVFEADRFEEAEALLRRTLKIREAAYGPDSPETAMALVALGRVLTERGEYREALELGERGLRIHEQAVGPDHPVIAQTLCGLGKTRLGLGELDVAEELLRRAVEISEAAVGTDHPDTALAYHGLAEVLLARGDRAGARALFERALEIRKRRLGPAHPDTVETRDALAELSGRSQPGGV